jgi:hypothetical protein
MGLLLGPTDRWLVEQYRESCLLVGLPQIGSNALEIGMLPVQISLISTCFRDRWDKFDRSLLYGTTVRRYDTGMYGGTVH